MVENRSASRYASLSSGVTHKRCAKCGKLVSRSSMRCRRCGQRQRWSRRKLLLASSVALIAAMFAIAINTTFFPNGRVAESSVPTAATHATPRALLASRLANATSVTASDLWMAYMRDPAAADRMFRDRSVVVSGRIRAIDRDFDGGTLVRLSTGDAMDTVNAKLATQDSPAVLGVHKGREISLLCVGRGAAIGVPLLGGCMISS